MADASQSQADGQGELDAKADEDRMFKCAECGEAAELGAVDEEDGQWYCKGCWEALLDDGTENNTKAQAQVERPALDEDSEGVAVVISDVRGAGFRLSKEGLGLLRGRGKDYTDESEGKEVPRTDPELVALVRDDAARMSGEGTSLVIRRVPREAFEAKTYRIHEVDGKEILAIDVEAYRTKAESQDRERAAVGKLLAMMNRVLYEGKQSDQERVSSLRSMAPAALLCDSKPEEALATLAANADNFLAGGGG